MDLVQLEYFKAVAEAGHLTNAARKLNVAQPALSVSIARLENEVGVPLFDRVGRGIYLNKCGEIYLEYVEQALGVMKKAQSEVDTYCEKLENVMTLGVVSKPFSQIMLMEFKSLYPNCSIRQIDLSAGNVEEELLKNQVDYVITACLSPSPGIVGEEIRREQMVLVVPSSHPLADRSHISLGEARGEKFINLPKEYEYRKNTDRMCQEAGFTPDVAMECFHCHMVELVSAGHGVALMTRDRAMKNQGNDRIRILPVRDPEYYMCYYIVWKAGHHFNKISREFRKYLKEHCGAEEVECGGCEG